MAVPGRVATGQQLEGKMRPRSFLFFFSRRDASKFTRFQLALRERVRLFDSAELPRRQEGGIPKPGWPAGLGEGTLLQGASGRRLGGRQCPTLKVENVAASGHGFILKFLRRSRLSSFMVHLPWILAQVMITMLHI